MRSSKWSFAWEVLGVHIFDGKTKLRLVKGGSSSELDWSALRSVFVYGKEVADFRSVDYGKLFLLNLGVTQQLLKEQKEYDALQKRAASGARELKVVERKIELLEQTLEKLIKQQGR